MMIQQPFRKIPILIFCFIVYLLAAQNAAGQIIDRVAAVVNNDIILLSDVQHTGERYFQKVKEEAPATSLQENMREVESQVLDNLIDQTLVKQKAKKENLSVTDEDYHRAYAMMVKRSGLTKEEFLDNLKKSGVTPAEYEKDLRYQILQEKLINRDIRSKVVITDSMVKKYYDQHKAKYTKTKGGYTLLQIGFTWGTTDASKKSAPNMYADKLDAKRRAEEVRKMAQEGQDFKELAQKYSNLPSAADGGDIGTLQLEDMAPDMRDAITVLKPGQISKIIETPAGYQFFKLIADKEGVDPKSSYENAQESIRETLYQQQLKKEFANWVKNLRQQAYIKKLYP